MKIPARIGSVPYLNALPLTYGLEARCRFLPPSELACHLHDGRVNAALLSVTEALLRPGFRIVDGVAIGSDGPVASVFLAHRDPLEAIRVVHLDPASLTSANLLRLLLAERGLRPEFRPLAGYGREDMPDNVLLIGNPAITFALGPHDHRILDLGEAWLAMTGLPFVYAAWTVRETAATAGLAEELRAAAAAGVAAIPRLVETAPDFTPAFRRAYLGGHIRYGLGEREKAGLERFRNLLERHVGLPTRPAVFF